MEAEEDMKLPGHVLINDLVYADDMLLIDIDCKVLQKFMDHIAEVGQEYGLIFNWKKLEMLPIRTKGSIFDPDGNPIKTKEAMVYLGAILSSCGDIASELARRIGIAQADFNTLTRIWKHSTLQRKKIQIFNACICSKLAYGLSTSTFTTREMRKINGFQNRCLRKIVGIRPAYYSRISNATV